MKQQPDHLFRDKLENFRMNPPAHAWSRIEDRLDQSSSKGLWLKIAAGLALLTVAGILIWNSTVTDPANTIAHQKVTKETEVPANGPDHTLSENSPNGNALPRHAETIKKLQARPIEKVKKITLLGIEENQVAEINPDTPPIVETKASTEALLTKAGTAVAEALLQTHSTSTGVYLVYTAKEVNEKYLRTQPEEEATPAEKKSSRMQMLMGVAYNLKNGEVGFGELRHMKDEIFALNFLDDKKQETKKN